MKLYRKDFDLMGRRPGALGLWSRILCMASRVEFEAWMNSKVVLLPAGSIVTSLEELSESKRSRDISEVRRNLQFLEKLGRINQKMSQEGRIISILNWETKEVGEERKITPENTENGPKFQQTNNKLETDEKQDNDKRGDEVTSGNHFWKSIENSQLTNERHTTDSPVTNVRHSNGEEEEERELKLKLKANFSPSVKNSPEEEINFFKIRKSEIQEDPSRGEELSTKGEFSQTEKLSSEEKSQEKSEERPSERVLAESKLEAQTQDRAESKEETNTPQSSCEPPSSRVKAKKEVSSGPCISPLIASYVRAYQKRYEGVRPDVGGKVRGEMVRFLKDHPEKSLQEVCELIQTYCSMPDDFFSQRRHDFTTFVYQQNKVLVEHAARRAKVVSIQKMNEENEERVAREAEKKKEDEASEREWKKRVDLFESTFPTAELKEKAIDQYKRPSTQGKPAYITAVYRFSEQEQAQKEKMAS